MTAAPGVLLMAKEPAAARDDAASIRELRKQLHALQQRLDAPEAWECRAPARANNHGIGGIMMSADPRDGAVDGNCRARDYANRRLVGGGTILSASMVNSTPRTAALALRPAADIATTLKGG